LNCKDILIRNAKQTDIPHLLNLLQQLFSIEKDFTFDAAKQKKGLSMMLDGCGKHRTVKVACHNDNIVGMCSVQTRISTATGSISATIEDLVVNSCYRHRGIGKKMLEAIQAWAKKRGIKTMQLLADKNNSSALKFYTAQKWSTTNLICLTKTIKE